MTVLKDERSSSSSSSPASGTASALRNKGTRLVQSTGKHLGIPTAIGDTDHTTSLPFFLPPGWSQAALGASTLLLG